MIFFRNTRECFGIFCDHLVIYVIPTYDLRLEMFVIFENLAIVTDDKVDFVKDWQRWRNAEKG